MSMCEPSPQAVQQVGAIEIGYQPEPFAIVPDINSSTLELQGCKRSFTNSDSLSELIELQLGPLPLPEPKRCCYYSINNSSSSTNSSPCNDQIDCVESSRDIFTFETEASYFFGGSSNTPVFGSASSDSSPAANNSSSGDINFTTTSNSNQIASSSMIEQNQLFETQPAPLTLFSPSTTITTTMQQQQPQTVLSHPHHVVQQQHAEKYEIVIAEQPEEYYRARYNSEGVRAPLKGMTENYPTVQVFGREFRYGRVDVKLVHEDGTSHTSCSLDTSEGRKNAVSKKIGPFNNMTAEFEDLRIRRVKKEGRKKSSNNEKSAPKDSRRDKIASLLFTTVLETEHGEIVQSIKSRPISLTAAPEPAELDWLEPNRGHFAGQEPLVIKGSKMTSPRVTFRITLPDGRRQELHGSVDKERSHQNVLLVKTPSLAQMSYQFAHQTIQAEVLVITGRNQMSSNALQFDFIPNHICRECMQETPRAAHISPATYSVCSPSALPSYAAAQSSSNIHSPPTTPGLPPPPQPSSDGMGTQMQQNPSSIQAISVDTLSSPASSTIMISPEMSACPLTQDIVIGGGGGSGTSGKRQEDINCIMRNLMGEECSNTPNLALSLQEKEMDAQYLYVGAAATSYAAQMETHMQQQQQQASSSSSYIPVTSPSVASDQQCYSPITPVHSPTSSAPWTYIEQMLSSLLRNEQITPHDYRFLQDECIKHNPYLLQAFDTSQSNEGVFLQQLAYYKPDQPSFQATLQ